MTLQLATYLIAMLSVFGCAPIEKPAFQGAHVRRVCYDRLAIHLGDDYDSVAAAYQLNPDANGPSMDSSSRVDGRSADFLWNGEDHLLDDGDILHPLASLTFSDRGGLRRVSIGWYLDGDRNPAQLEEIVAAMKRLHPCLADALRPTGASKYYARIDFGTYAEELTVAINADADWQIGYEISAQP